MSIWKTHGLVYLLVTFLCPSLLPASTDWTELVERDWLRQDSLRTHPARQGGVTAQEDAAGAVDGEKTGKWGFHTGFQDAPWWQVDLESSMPIDYCLFYNRCDAYSERTARMILEGSEDGLTYVRLYQHNGNTFWGQTDGKPLRVDLQGVKTRFLRVRVPGADYLHLDEVEVYGPGQATNLALRKPATQSSLSEWSAGHARAGVDPFPLAQVVVRGQKLAAALARLGVQTHAEQDTLAQLLQRWQSLPPGTPAAAQRSIYFQARWTVRRLALRNPLLDFDSLLFLKRAPSMFPHMSDQHYGWWSRPGGGIYRLSGFKTTDVAPELVSLAPTMAPGNFMGPDLSFDGRRLLFAYCKFYPGLSDEKNKADKTNVPEDAFYHVFELNLDSGNIRQLTRGKYDDFEPRYLPSGDIAFVSTRKGTAIQCSDWFADSTRAADRPDSYVRCGGDSYRPVPVFTLHALDPQSGRIRSLSAFENFEWTPSLANDGRLIYTRWDYIDRFNGHFFSLWSANQDGTNPQLVYGNYTVKPQVVFEARAIPNSAKLVFTASAHHSNLGGTICLLDRERGTEGDAPITRLTPDCRFPETEANDPHYYANPWPLSEEFFLVAWSDSPLPPHGRFEGKENPVNSMGLYLLDAFGNLELLYRDPAISSMYPLPLRPRPLPPVHPIAATGPDPEATVLLQDVYAGLGGVPRGSVKSLRVVGVVPKVQPHMNQPVLGISAEDPGKFVLGTTPVAADGSAYFRIPSGVPVFFQALDSSGVAVQTMRTLTYAVRGQTLSCIGCHEHRDLAPATGSLSAVHCGPAPLTAGPHGSWPLRFDQLVQPVLDRYCIECHRADGSKPRAAELALTPDKAYETLLGFGDQDLKKKAFERDRSYPREAVAANSRLWSLLSTSPGHQDITLDPESRERLATWLDTYAHLQGSFSSQQEKELLALRESLAPLLAPPPAEEHRR